MIMVVGVIFAQAAGVGRECDAGIGLGDTSSPRTDKMSAGRTAKALRRGCGVCEVGRGDAVPGGEKPLKTGGRRDV